MGTTIKTLDKLELRKGNSGLTETFNSFRDQEARNDLNAVQTSLSAIQSDLDTLLAALGSGALRGSRGVGIESVNVVNVEAGASNPKLVITYDDAQVGPTEIPLVYIKDILTDGDDLKIILTDYTEYVIQNVRGPRGEAGRTGPRGPRGPMICKAAIDADNLILTAEDGTVFNAGYVRGEKGDPGAGLVIKGSYTSENELKTAHKTGKDGDAYLVNGELYVWVNGGFQHVGRIKGEDGVGIAKLEIISGDLYVTYTGTTARIPLGKVKGDDGNTPTITIKNNKWRINNEPTDTYATAIQGAEINEAGELVFTSQALGGTHNVGRIVGKSAYEIAKDNGRLPTAGATEAEWIESLKGEQGPQGTGINILGSCTSPDSLPTTGSPGDAYLVNGFLYVWDGDSWEPAGNIQGPAGESAFEIAQRHGVTVDETTWLASLKGDPGVPPSLRINPSTNEWEISVNGGDSWTSTTVKATGPTGLSAYEVAVATNSTDATTPESWVASLKGEPGTGINILKSFETEEAFKRENLTGSPGDAYLVAGNLYVWSGTGWSDVGRIKGEKGDDGGPGQQGTGIASLRVDGGTLYYRLDDGTPEQDAGDITAGQVVVTINTGSNTANFKSSDIFNKVAAGKVVIALQGSQYAQLMSATTDCAVFWAYVASENGVPNIALYFINDSGQVTVKNGELDLFNNG